MPVERRVLLTERRRSASFGTREEDAEMSTAITRQLLSLVRAQIRMQNANGTQTKCPDTFVDLHVRKTRNVGHLLFQIQNRCVKNCGNTLFSLSLSLYYTRYADRLDTHTHTLVCPQ